jgi:hypothetical protein
LVRTDTTALFERLREANIMLQEVVTGSQVNMSALENTLVMRVSEFVAAMNEVGASTNNASTRVENNIADFREITARVVADLSQIGDKFTDHGRNLASVADLLDNSNQRTEDGINERRLTLDSLISTLDIRTEELDQRLRRFSGLLDESLDAASARTRDIARVVSESSAESSRAISEQYERTRDIALVVAESAAEGSRAIAEQYERVRESGDEERRRTAETMRAIYEQTTDETHALLTDASTRFAETIQSMKQMAVEMQRELETTRLDMHRELEATRDELRRGMFELPQETADGAAQMRRVIVDQIEALAELNRIVARHGRHLDAVEPQRRPTREESTTTVSASRNETHSAPRSAAQRSEADGFAPAARRAEPVSLNETPSAATRGWLTELLNRASEGEATRDLPREPQPEAATREQGHGSAERTARHSIESLDSLSVDIARMIDHDAAADLWDRYKRGERNVFTRRLYTLQGQQAFDEIRKKYRAEREFKQTVDRYVEEFERLLDEVSRDDRGQVVARTYLTSETGKVYTMLAHAAGRFD